MGLPEPLLPELNDDVTAEILLRVASDEPACLFRASVVCKLWHRIISNQDFRRRYRAFHRDAPLLGFFYNLDKPTVCPNFVATTVASPLRKAAAAHNARRVSRALDCRHGRVLLEKQDGRGALVVWDPIADDWIDLPPPGIRYSYYTAVVLCDEAACDHRDCRCGGRFLVVCLGTDCTGVREPYACVYSSEDCAWRAPVSGSTGCTLLFLDKNRPAIIGDGIYCTDFVGEQILRYDLVQRSFSVIGMPHEYRRDPVLMQNNDGSLGLAGMRGSCLYLWSRRWNNREEGDAAGWVLRRVIDLEKLLPVFHKHCIKATVIGFAEGIDVFIISTNVGLFNVNLDSGWAMRVSKQSKKYRSIVPFFSFFTPDCTS